MLYSYDFKNFLDSPDTRAFNKDTNFVPAEQAIFIMMCYKKSVEEKLSALKYLLRTYSEDEFGADEVDCNNSLKRFDVSFKEVVQHKVDVWESVLQDRFDNHGVVFAAIFNEQGFSNSSINNARLFSDYNKAYSYLKNEKNSYLENPELQKVQIYGRILRIKVDSQCDWQEWNEYRYDNELYLIDIIENQNQFYMEPEKKIPDLSENFYIRIPLPFKAGDLVKAISPYWSIQIGIVSADPPDKEHDVRWLSGHADASDLRMALDVLDSETRCWQKFDGINPLQLEYCSEEECIAYKDMVSEWKRRRERLLEEENYKNRNDGLIDNTVVAMREFLKDVDYYDVLKISDRNQSVIKAFLNGSKYKELAEEYQLSISSIRSIIVGYKIKVSKHKRMQGKEGEKR